jgi:hypothetical protein
MNIKSYYELDSEVKGGSPWLDFTFAFAATEEKTFIWVSSIENSIYVDFFHITFFGPLKLRLRKVFLLILYFSFRIDSAVGCTLPHSSRLFFIFAVPFSFEPILGDYCMDLSLLLLDFFLVPFLHIISRLREESCCCFYRTRSAAPVVFWFRLACCLALISVWLSILFSPNCC